MAAVKLFIGSFWSRVRSSAADFVFRRISRHGAVGPRPLLVLVFLWNYLVFANPIESEKKEN